MRLPPLGLHSLLFYQNSQELRSSFSMETKKKDLLPVTEDPHGLL
ncbi:hypothetical protein BBEV_0534 [Salisediminibacterium beveridgei]|uniref:Uncharacterized protein n=1 Tax=Salisediminibacterium beveridgei TaxID=632773 RepID=A0A1D7QSF6_9BACI|nr:hypothetical protein BBEV_0534 [Salisediminibacterium beveridgei]